MELKRTEELFDILSGIVDYPLHDGSERIELSFVLSISSMQFGAAVRALCAQQLALGASATLRSQYEALVRSVWALHAASDTQVSKLSATLSEDSQKACKNIPSVNQMISALESSPKLENIMVSLNEFKKSSWLPLNSFVHSGIHAIHWTKNRVPPELLDQIFRISNGLTLLAYQGVGILTRRRGIQSEIIGASASFSDCLPNPR